MSTVEQEIISNVETLKERFVPIFEMVNDFDPREAARQSINQR